MPVGSSKPQNLHISLLTLGTVQNSSTPVSPSVIDLAKSSLPAAYADPVAPLATINDNFLAASAKDASHVFAHARAASVLGSTPPDQIEAAIVKALDTSDEPSLADALRGIELLKELKCSRAAIGEFVQSALVRFPDAKSLLERDVGLPEDS